MEQSGQRGEVVWLGLMWCFQVRRKGDLLQRSCERSTLVFLGRDSSDGWIAMWGEFVSLLFSVFCRKFCTMVEWMVLQFCLMLSSVMVVGLVGLQVGAWRWNIDVFIFLGGVCLLVR